MALFGRRRRVNVGRYVAPDPTVPAPVERVVEEGVLIIETAVRMSVKNAVILSSLRDRLDLDRTSLRRHAADELRAAAAHELESLERVRAAAAAAAGKPKPRYVGDVKGVGEPIDVAAERVRPALAERLRELAADEAHLDALVERARTEAWSEIAVSFERRALALTDAEQRAVDDGAGAAGRDARLAEFLELDLGPALRAAEEQDEEEPA
ncbi:hypothetical protein [Schumannella soli]|uniref:Asparagine synthase n=1 Tax=Schumannella soli TaxID=2590779 RepID=A0A506XV18_9MICO|nr:hypothetical protein [Schumannella soli]TPW73986.1 hypothetical protein FJ657_15125 [Schumannella soli]